MEAAPGRIRVLQICSADSIGGGERSLADLCNSLTERGHEIFVAMRPGSPLEGELKGIPAANLLFPRMSNSIDLVSAYQISKFARQSRVGLIHAHLGRDYPLAALASRISGIPFVLTRHVLFPLKRIHKLILRHVSGVSAPSNAVAESLLQQNILPTENLTTIRYGIDLSNFPLVKRDYTRVLRIGAIGNLDPVKGHDVFIRAAKHVNQLRPDIRFDIVGEDRSAAGNHRRDLQRLISELKLDGVVTLAGWRGDIPTFFREIDLFVSASRVESFGIAIAEAMLTGLPVVATRSAGASEIVENGVSGLLVPVEDHTELSNTLLRLIDDPKLQKQLAANARKRVVDNFSLERMANETEVFYRSFTRPHEVPFEASYDKL